jgi:hypothetical protein
MKKHSSDGNRSYFLARALHCGQPYQLFKANDRENANRYPTKRYHPKRYHPKAMRRDPLEEAKRSQFPAERP